MKWYMRVSLLILTVGALGFIGLSQSVEPEDQLGIASKGETALEFISKADQQSESNAVQYGYITHIFDVSESAVFTNPNNATEATARFTFSAALTLDTPRLAGNLIVHVATGTLSIYFNEAPAGNFNDPTSFSKGQLIATYSTRTLNILNVQAPNQGIQTAVSDFEQLTANRFTFQGKQHQFGRPGLLLRSEMTGEGTRTSVDPLMSVTFLAGQATITGQR